MQLHEGEYRSLLNFISEVNALHKLKDDSCFNERLLQVLQLKQQDEKFKENIHSFFTLLFAEGFFVNALTDYGIHSNRGFIPELVKKIKHKYLPPLTHESELGVFIHFLCHSKKQHQWLLRVNPENWQLFLNLISADNAVIQSKIYPQIKNALVILSHRLVTIGLDPYLVKKLPELDDVDSPFFELNKAIGEFSLNQESNDEIIRHIRSELSKCEKIFNYLIEEKDNIGTSLHLTFVVKRAQQHIDRLRLLLDLFSTQKEDDAVKQLSYALIKAENEKNKIINFIKENTGLLAYRISSHTSEKGEYYVGFSKKENSKLFLSAMGGGLVVVILVIIKHFIHELHLSLFPEGLLFGLNYGLGFVAMHLLHLTLATKQPAMTASYIAESIQNNNEEKQTQQVLKQIINSQFISLIGNLVIVIPFCLAIGWMLHYFFDAKLFNEATAKAHLMNNHPFFSLSLIYAVFTGVFLTLTGLVTGYYDNKVVFGEFAERIRKHPVWIHKYSSKTLNKAAAFVEKNAGAIIGNLFLGLCLGLAGNLGSFFGLPLDIRHVTISAGNFSLALASFYEMPGAFVATALTGVILIGLLNILSSFLFSFIIACASRNLSAKKSVRLLLSVLRRK